MPALDPSALAICHSLIWIGVTSRAARARAAIGVDLRSYFVPKQQVFMLAMSALPSRGDAGCRAWRPGDAAYPSHDLDGAGRRSAYDDGCGYSPGLDGFAFLAHPSDGCGTPYSHRKHPAACEIRCRWLR